MAPAPELEAVRAHAAAELVRLPATMRGLVPASYSVTVSDALASYRDAVAGNIRAA